MSCELWLNNQAVSRESYQSALFWVCIISSLHVKQSKSNKVISIIIFPLWYTPESNHKIYCDLSGNEHEKYASIYANIDCSNYRSSYSQIMEWLFYRFRKIPRKATAVKSYFSSYRLCHFIKTGCHCRCFHENFPTSSEQIFFM